MEPGVRSLIRRDLSQKHYVYVWADGIHVKVRLEDDANNQQCLLVLMGATSEGKKELIAVIDGYRESEQSWSELLLDLKQRGSAQAGRGRRSLWILGCVSQALPRGREQRCWVHKTANVLNNMPKSVQPKAKADIHEIRQAETRRLANRAFDQFLEKYGPKYPGGLRMPQEGPGRLVDVLRLPGRTLVALANDQPDRVDVRHDSSSGTGGPKAAAAAEPAWR